MKKGFRFARGALLMSLVGTLLLPVPAVGSPEPVLLERPYEEAFVEKYCGIFVAVPGTCSAEGTADRTTGFLAVDARTISLHDGALPGGTSVRVDAGFLLRSFLTEPATSVTVDVDYAITDAAIEATGTTFGWASGFVAVVAWVAHEDCDCLAQQEERVLELKETRSAVTDRPGSLTIVLRAPEGGFLPPGLLAIEVRVSAWISLANTIPPLGDTGSAYANATLTVDRVTTTTEG